MATSDEPPAGFPSGPPATSPPPAGADKKRAWIPPRIQSGQLFESNSLACAKNGPELEQCGQVPPFKS